MKLKTFLSFGAMFGAMLLAAADAPAQPEIVAVPANNVGSAFKTVKLPAMELKDGEKAILSFKVWIPSAANTGWTNAVKIRVNGKEVTSANAFTRKEIVADFGKGKIEKLPLFDKKNTMITFYAKDIAAALDKRITSDREQGFTFKFDVSNMVTADRDNYISLHNVRYLYQMRQIFKNPQYEFIVNFSEIKLTAGK